MTQAPVDALCQELLTELRRDPRGRRVAGLLREYAERHEDWREYALFSDECYTRNLVHRSGTYELLLLCWGEGHESPIHDHEGQNCWMAVLDGELEEACFRAPEVQPAPLVEGVSKRFRAGGVAFIDDGIGLHLIRPVDGGRGVSLHLYSSPIDECRIFDAGTGEATRVSLGYHSVRGEICGERTAASVRRDWA